MNLPSEEFLKAILFGGTLADKLAKGELFTAGEARGTSETLGTGEALGQSSLLIESLHSLETPGRTGKLSLWDSNSQGKSQFPKNKELLIPSNRGRLLHYFANHELLAIETMAFVLLRFPDADPTFRAGVLRTLQDEQRHLSHYLKRMNDFGVEMGDFPLNLYFWKTLRQMRSPMDFVIQMSMTFEQANLDFALFYADLFQTEIDDAETGKLLKEVHDDEIKHVAHGVKWFSEWRDPKETEYESYVNLLPYPMTPRRARGKTFFAAASREASGMSKDFIESVRIAGGSRGKVPSYLFFNPQAEIETAVPELPKHLKQKIDELAPVMLWLAHEEDVVELPAQPPLTYLTKVHALKGELPEIVTRVPSGKYVTFDEFKPWGFSQSAWKKMTELGIPFRQPPGFTQNLHAEKLFSKVFWKNALAKLPDETLDKSDEILIKVDRSTSGRGHLRIPRERLNTPEIQSKLTKIKARGEDVVIEPFYPKVNDFSLQYELTADGRLIEYDPRFFVVDHLFQYQGAMIGKGSAHPFFEESARLVERELSEIKKAHAPVIQILKDHQYTGPFGIDALTYRQKDGSLKIAPVIEVNARYTMGRVAQEVEALIQGKKQKQGAFRILTSKDLRAFQAKNFADLESELIRQYGENFTPITPSSASETWAFAVFAPDAVNRFLLEQNDPLTP